MDKMERIRGALELAVAEQWDADPRDNPVRPSALREATAAPRPVNHAEVARLVVQPAAQKKVPPAPVVRSNASDAPGMHATAADAGKPAEQRLVAAWSGNPARQPFCVLQAVVAERLDERRATTLGVTAARTGSGTTLTAVNLAIGLAKDARRKVALVDLNLARPAVHTIFGHDVNAGLEDCLFEGVALPKALFCPSVEGLVVLPARGRSSNVAEVLRSAKLAKLLEEFRGTHPRSIVILDLPPIADRNDASVLERLSDALLLVVEDGVTTEREFRRVSGAIEPSKLLGTVLNRADATA
jgi:Mrp family chromosome partitioning ATPase